MSGQGGVSSANSEDGPEKETVAVWAIGEAASAVTSGAAELEAQVGQAQEEASASLSELKPAHSMWLQPS